MGILVGFGIRFFLVFAGIRCPALKARTIGILVFFFFESPRIFQHSQAGLDAFEL
jgi:hypothetical protein